MSERHELIPTSTDAPRFEVSDVHCPYELDASSNLYRIGRFQLPAIYGRLWVGKTSPFATFTQDKTIIFFTVVEDNPLANLRSPSRVISGLDQSDAGLELTPNYADLQSAFARAHSH